MGGISTQVLCGRTPQPWHQDIHIGQGLAQEGYIQNVAQSVVYLVWDQDVAGSSPVILTIKNTQ